jgi:hypothetical protein
VVTDSSTTLTDVTIHEEVVAGDCVKEAIYKVPTETGKYKKNRRYKGVILTFFRC